MGEKEDDRGGDLRSAMPGEAAEGSVCVSMVEVETEAARFAAVGEEPRGEAEGEEGLELELEDGSATSGTCPFLRHCAKSAS